MNTTTNTINFIEKYKYTSNTGPKYLYTSVLVKEYDMSLMINFTYWLDTKQLFIIKEGYSFEDKQVFVMLIEKEELEKTVNSIINGFNSLI